MPPPARPPPSSPQAHGRPSAPPPLPPDNIAVHCQQGSRGHTRGAWVAQSLSDCLPPQACLSKATPRWMTQVLTSRQRASKQRLGLSAGEGATSPRQHLTPPFKRPHPRRPETGHRCVLLGRQAAARHLRRGGRGCGIHAAAAGAVPGHRRRRDRALHVQRARRQRDGGDAHLHRLEVRGAGAATTPRPPRPADAPRPP